MISLNDVLLAASNIPVDDPIAEIWGRQMQGGYRIIEYTGSLPITITANGDALLDYRIYGADGGVGERVDITGLSEPLCGIQTYTDSLDLSTGILTRRIKKFVLTGEEEIQDYSSGSPVKYIINIPLSKAPLSGSPIGVCTHYFYGNAFTTNNAFSIDLGNPQWYRKIIVRDKRFTIANDLKAYLAAQYAAGTPVTFWYILAKPDVSTIPVPSGLTGTIEGYLIQDGTPTPETPIYPTANGVKQADGTYSIEYGYKLPMIVHSENLWNKDEIIQIQVTSDASIVRYGMTFSGITFSLYLISNSSIYYKIKTGDTYGIAIQLPVGVVRSITITNNQTLLIYGENLADTQRAVIQINSSSCIIPIYIGENQLDAGEYVSYGKQKIYRDVSGTLTPTDPPVPLPEIPTIDGTTIIDYDGTPKPSQMYVKYKGKSDGA